ncbi:MAG: hypothetical protein PQJ49_01450 [Sphaerochaetaceae bacterium]|nr:hypothetical protein [Sphaerochaetaceae bacterium]
MKKLFIILVALIAFTSCSTDDSLSREVVEEGFLFEYPEWLEGKWLLIENGQVQNVGFIFESGEITSITLGGIETNINETLTPLTVVTENISEDFYEVTIEYNDGSSLYYDFERMWAEPTYLIYGTSTTLQLQP